MIMRLLTRLAPLRRLPAAARYFATALLIVLFLGIRLGLEPYLAGYPFIVFIPAIIVIALVFGSGPGLFATVLSATAATYFFVEPRRSLLIPDVNTGLVLSLYVALGFFLSAVIEALRSTVTLLSDLNAKLEDAERHAETLLRELNHRIRNDLHGIFVLLRQQQRLRPEPDAKEVVAAVSERIRLLSRVYSQLQRRHGEALVDASAFIRGLVTDLETAFKGAKPIAIRTSADAVMIPLVQAVPFGLIINELVTNAVKHAFPGERAGTIDVEFHRDNGQVRLCVRDNGVGISGEPRAGSQGTRLVNALVEQLGGRLTVESAAGASFTIQVPAKTGS